MSAQPVYRPTERVERRNSSTTRRRRRTVRRRSSGTNISNIILAQAILFLVISASTYGFFTLLGHSLKEQARHESIRANGRTRVALNDLSRIRSRVGRLVSMRIVDDWSKQKGFVASYTFPKMGEVPKTQQVAKRDTSMKLALIQARAIENELNR